MGRIGRVGGRGVGGGGVGRRMGLRWVVGGRRVVGRGRVGGRPGGRVRLRGVRMMVGRSVRLLLRVVCWLLLRVLRLLRRQLPGVGGVGGGGGRRGAVHGKVASTAHPHCTRRTTTEAEQRSSAHSPQQPDDTEGMDTERGAEREGGERGWRGLTLGFVASGCFMRRERVL